MAFAAVNFERQTLADGLRQAGFDASKPAFCAWLGVVPYLTAEAFGRTIDFLGKLPPASGAVFDYGVPPSTLRFVERMAFKALAARVAAAGEPFQLYFEPAELREKLLRAGFSEIEDLGVRELNERYFAGRTDGFWLRSSVGRLLCARV
jgi:O-methyltransferase involved in polyketide biosynthesis